MTTTTITGGRSKKILHSFGIPPVYLFLIVIFVAGGVLDQIFSDGQVFSNRAIQLNILVRSVALGIVAVGQTLVIIGASIDLSVAYTISITAVMSSYIMQSDPANVPLAILVVFAIGAVIGLVNGLIITKLHVNAFITTLGTSLVIKGIINATFSNYTGSVPKSFQYFGYETIGPIPIAILVLAIIVIAGGLLKTNLSVRLSYYRECARRLTPDPFSNRKGAPPPCCHLPHTGESQILFALATASLQ